MRALSFPGLRRSDGGSPVRSRPLPDDVQDGCSVSRPVGDPSAPRAARLAAAGFAVVALLAAAAAGCGGGTDDSASAEAAVQAQYPDSEATCAKSDYEYGGDKAYSCTLGAKRLCVALIDGELLELWDERPLRPGEPGYSDQFGATVRTGPSC